MTSRLRTHSPHVLIPALTAVLWLAGCSSPPEGEGTDVASAAAAAPGMPRGVTHLSLSYGSTCAVLGDGEVACWGRNSSGQLGTSADPSLAHPRPALVPGISQAAEVSLGSDHACATFPSGAASCWGNDFFGQRGDGARTGSPQPTLVSGLDAVTHLSSAVAFSCAATERGIASCWGTDSFGELGDDGQATLSSTPVDVPGVRGVIAVATGQEHACALIAPGTVTCWGSNDSGQLGPGAASGQSTPVDAGITNVVGIALGLSHTCALRSDGAVVCWGYDGTGTLPSAERATPRAVPANTVTASAVIKLAAGGNDTCALHQNGTVSCWGSNEYGQLGDGTTDDSRTPVFVVGLSQAVAVVVGDGHACARRADGTVSCWGENDFGQLGDGTTTDRHMPVDVIGLGALTASE